MQENKTLDITGIVPVYNEEKFLEESIKRLINAQVVDKIIIIDDSSTDKSPIIIDKLVDEFKSIKSYKTPHNLGKGGALNFIKHNISTSYVVIHDADLEYFPNDIFSLKEKINHSKPTFVIGSRFIGDTQPQHYIRTFFANKFLSKLFSLKNKTKVSDIASCYKLFPSDFFKNTNFVSNGFEFEVEIVAKFLYYSKNLHECGISYKSRTYEEGKKIKFIDFFKYIYAVFKF